MEPNIIKISPDTEKIYQQSKSIVIKVGSSLLVEEKLGAIKKKWFASFIEDVVHLRKLGKTVIIVSSGAINLGRKILNIKDNELTLEQEQAAASVGQIELSKEYQEHFKHKGLICSQILITLDDFTNRRRYLNCKSTLKTLLKFGVIPIVNENDTVATDEIRYGDNDRLAAQVASICESDLLILLSDIDGLYEKDPNLNPNTKHLPVINEVTKKMLEMASQSTSINSKGGMITKLEAAKIAMNGGCEMIIANGLKKFPISNFIFETGKYTRFIPRSDVKTLRKQWILSIKTKGKLKIDRGAIKALINHKSLLPAGVIESFGNFERGDAVEIISKNNEKIGQGLSGYSSFDVQQIKGCKTNEIEKKLGHPGRVAMIHTDDLVLI